jgi:ribosomal-protein-alanine N-acetyltransferase
MLTINFHPFKNLETERLVLRRVIATDAAEIMELRGNPETMKFVPRPLVTSHDQALEHFNMIDAKIENNEGINWAITLKGNPKLIGIIGHYRIQPEHYRSEIGYMVLPEYNGQGITSEAVKAILMYGFDDMQLHSVEAIIDPNNHGSARVLEKSGFVKEAHFVENECYNGVFKDTAIYSLLEKNFKR